MSTPPIRLNMRCIIPADRRETATGRPFGGAFLLRAGSGALPLGPLALTPGYLGNEEGVRAGVRLERRLG